VASTWNKFSHPENGGNMILRNFGANVLHGVRSQKFTMAFFIQGSAYTSPWLWYQFLPSYLHKFTKWTHTIQTASFRLSVHMFKPRRHRQDMK
jgi:hypothetical protein